MKSEDELNKKIEAIMFTPAVVSGSRKIIEESIQAIKQEIRMHDKERLIRVFENEKYDNVDEKCYSDGDIKAIKEIINKAMDDRKKLFDEHKNKGDNNE